MVRTVKDEIKKCARAVEKSDKENCRLPATKNGQE